MRSAAVDNRWMRVFVALAMLASVLVVGNVAQAGHQFPDVPNGHFFHEEITWMADEGHTTGFPDGTYKPGDPVRRQAAAAFVYRFAGSPAVTGNHPFDDVPPEHFFHDPISWLWESGIARGFDDGGFRPYEPMTRQAVAAFFFGLAGKPDQPRSPEPFSDVPESHPFHEEISWLAATGITQGFDDGTFRPSRITKRQAAAAFLFRYANLGIAPGGPDALTLTPAESTNPAGTQHTLTAKVTDENGASVQTGTPVRFEVYRADATRTADTFVGPAETADRSTNTDGEAVFTYTGPEFEAEDQIVACVPENGSCQVAGGGEFAGDAEVGADVSDTATKFWEVEVDSVDPDEGDTWAINPPSTPHTVSVTATDADGEPVEGARIRFEVYRGFADDVTELEDETDLADVTFSGPVETSRQWTDSDGRASFTYTGPDEDAIDRIVVCRPVGNDCLVADEDPQTEGTQFTGEPDVGAEPNAVTTKIWDTTLIEEPPPTDTIDPDEGDTWAVNPTSTADEDSEHTVSVTYTDAEGAPVEGADVRFEVYRGASDDVTELEDEDDLSDITFSGPVEANTAQTGADGRASFTYIGPEEDAVDRIVICVPEDGSCQVADEDEETEGTQFTGDPDVGAEPNAVTTKIWDTSLVEVPGEPAVSAWAQGSGLEISGIVGDDILTGILGPILEGVPILELLVQPPTPLVRVDVPTAEGDRSDSEFDEVLEVPASPVADVGVLRVGAAADLDEGWAMGFGEVADAEVLPGAIDGDEVVGAELIRAQADASCPVGDDWDSPAALDAASAGSQFIDLIVLGQEIPLDVGPNTVITGTPLDELVRITIRETTTFGDPDEGEFGYRVRGVVVEVLSAIGEDPLLEIVLGEAFAAIDCG